MMYEAWVVSFLTYFSSTLPYNEVQVLICIFPPKKKKHLGFPISIITASNINFYLGKRSCWKYMFYLYCRCKCECHHRDRGHCSDLCLWEWSYRCCWCPSTTWGCTRMYFEWTLYIKNMIIKATPKSCDLLK